MKVCYVNYLSPSVIHGGAERVVLNEANMMTDNSNEAFIISLKHSDNIPSEIYLHNGRVRNLFLPVKTKLTRSTLGKGLNIISSLYNPISLAHFRRLLTLEQPDIVHFHQLGPISAGALKVAKQLGFKVVQTFHGYHFECPKGSKFRRSQMQCNSPPIYCRLYKKAYRDVIYSGDHIIAISSYIKQQLLESGYSSKIITLLPNSISLKRLKHFVVKPKQPKEVLFVGRMVKAKGVHILLRALKKIEGMGERYIVNLIGDGEDRIIFEKLARSLSLGVNFTGRVPSEILELYYERATIVVIPSIFPESFGLVALEAALHRCPAIASNIGALPDVVQHGQTGFLFKPNNSDELAELISLLLGDEKLVENMGKRAVEVTRKYSNANHKKQLLNIYNRVLTFSN